MLRTDDYVRYLQRPSLLRDELGDAAQGTLTVIDEIQKVLALLDEVHWLIEHQRLVLALCGSSARELRRGRANLLGGRAVRYKLFGFVSTALGRKLDLVRAANHGVLPRHYLADRPARKKTPYVDDYLTSEIATEALVRSAAIGDTELVNFQNIARECAVSSPTMKEYYQILVDTLLGPFSPAFTARPKRRDIQAPKFFGSSCLCVGDWRKS